MDIVTDLTSQCVSFITVAQEVYKQQLPSGRDRHAKFALIAKQLVDFQVDISRCTENLQKRVLELVWNSTEDKELGFGEKIKTVFVGLLEKEDESAALIQQEKEDCLRCFFVTCQKLFKWLAECSPKYGVITCNLYSSACEWRVVVRGILYKDRAQRLILAEHLEYMPIQIILCLGGKDETAARKRMYQIWLKEPQDSKASLNKLSDADRQLINNWWSGQAPIAGKTKREAAVNLLKNDRLLLTAMVQEEIAIPFQNLFISELDEIAASRERRKDVDLPDGWNMPADSFCNINDPQERADKMGLYALAFSGGGIRSATFNLGILQRLAEKGVLSRFDYISTVSGGGYIGSWFASWVKRNGSLAKVSDRLNPRKSPDPLADEVRPIRWLRMFSNYLAPNAGIMSADSWTVGITWLRNTVINQVLLLMLLCSVLSLLSGGYGLWYLSLDGYCLTDTGMLVVSALLLGAGALLIGWGMHEFGPQYPPMSFDLEKKWWFYIAIKLWGIVGAWLTSTWLYNHVGEAPDFIRKLTALFGPAVLSFLAFLLVAWVGAYQKCAQSDKKPIEVYSFIWISSFVAAIAGWLLMALAWTFFESIWTIKHNPFPYFNHKLAFMLGVPVVLEVVSITVVVRMSILGVLFPDLRREWWGRIGAFTHRFILLWLLVFFCILMLPQCFDLLNQEIRHINLVALFGGWSVIIGYAVKLAFGSSSPGPGAKKSSFLTEAFVRFAPYLFALGLILFASILLNHMYVFFHLSVHKGSWVWSRLLIGLLLFVLAWFLTWRTGVNEFSLHHFYRNRLVRAYLGATRRREAREKTVNRFTGFDQEDDLLLADLTTDKNYYGPYPVINTTLNSTVITDLDRQDRKGESFVFTPKYCGFDVSRTRPSSNSRSIGFEYAYRPTEGFAYPNGPHLGTAMTISGAAVSPNMGYHSSPATAFLLTMFNVRLGWWIGNPRTEKWKNADPKAGLIYLVYDLIGKSDITSNYVCLSDGGHFDNMGLYEMVRRGCKYILLCDAEEDKDTTCEGLANAMRRCRIDFGVEISIVTDPITQKDKDTKYCKQHVAKGTIWYPGDSREKPSGTLVYVKTALTGKESVDIREYFMYNPAFPQQSTGDQFFDESQFESYRRLGYESIN